LALLLYYITDRTQFAGDETLRRRRLLEKIAEASLAGVDFLQLREKDLPARELELLVSEAVGVLHEAATPRSRTGNLKPKTRLLINSRTDVAIACRADGVHLRSDDILPSDVRQVWNHVGRADRPLVGVSCHAPEEVRRAASDGADFAVFAPVFEKNTIADARPAGLEALRQACGERIPVLALGGITLENAAACLKAGAAGIAGIRLFQGNEISKVVEVLRRLNSR
jgi:thiamine-phosphate pyrophosphorylase